MRNFLLASHNGTMLTSNFAVTDLKDGQLAFVKAGAFDKTHASTPLIGLNVAGVNKSDKHFDILMGNGDAQTIVLPIYAQDLSYSHMTYKAPVTFKADITINTPKVGTNTIVLVKKGVPFNERNKWSFDVYVPGDLTGAPILDATQLAKKFEAAMKTRFAESGDLTVSLTGTKLTITAAQPAVDYEVLLADELFDDYTPSTSGSVETKTYFNNFVIATTHAAAAEADKAMIIDMANKAVADTGINDTYQEASELMHPRYPITRGAASLADEYDVVTVRFAEPREMKTRDEVVHQIIQIAFPRVAAESPATGTVANPQLTAFKDILDKLV